jgi:hypothetical protein
VCVECLIGKQKKPSHDDELSIGISKWNLDSVSKEISIWKCGKAQSTIQKKLRKLLIDPWRGTRTPRPGTQLRTRPMGRSRA